MLASVAGAQAQVTYGPEVSLIGTNYTDNSNGRSSSAKAIISYRIGAVVDAPLCGHFSIQPAVFYVRNGYKFDANTVNVSVRVNTLEVPVNVMYKVDVHGGDNFFVGLGPYFALNMSGTYDESDNFFGSRNGSLNIGSGPTDILKTVDFGLGINTGYQLSNGLFLRLFYQKGLLNLAGKAEVGGTEHSTNYGIGVGMLFGGGHTHHAKR